MRLLTTPLTLAVLALPAGAEVTKTVRTELTAAEAARFNVENLVGSIRVEAGSGAGVAIVATVHAESQALADTLRFERRTWRGGEPVVRLTYPIDEHREYRSPNADGTSRFDYSEDGSADHGRYRLRVSRDSGVLLYADVEVQVPKRELEAGFYVRFGAIQGSGVSGTLRFDTSSGDIRLDHVGGDVLADSGSGDVNAEAVTGTFRCDTGSGNCRVRGFKGDRLELDTGSGDLDLQDVDARVVEADTGSGNVDAVMLGAQRIKADTGSGDVRVRLPRDASFELRADTGSGDIESGFRDAEPILQRREVVGYRRGDGAVKIDVDTGSGDVTVDPL